MAPRDDDAAEDVVDEITVRKSGEWYVAKSEGVGVTSQGRAEVEALVNLADAIGLFLKDEPDFNRAEMEEVAQHRRRQDLERRFQELEEAERDELTPLEDVDDTWKEHGYNSRGEDIRDVLRDAVKHPGFNRADLKTMLAGEVDIQEGRTHTSAEVKAEYGLEPEDE